MMNKIRFFVIINIFLINILCAQVFDSVAFDKKVDSLMNIWKIPGC